MREEFRKVELTLAEKAFRHILLQHLRDQCYAAVRTKHVHGTSPIRWSLSQLDGIKGIIAFVLRRSRLIQWYKPNDANPDTVAEQVLGPWS
jgi:hypothetical protein